MNARHLLAAVALAVAGTSAFAGGEFDPLTGFGPQAAPAPVAKKAKAPAAAASAAPAASSASSVGLTREQVKADFLKARAEGSIVNFDVGMEYARAPAGESRDREAVRAEARAAVRGNKSGS
ncbi:MAG: hypothetical protein ACM32J_12810 [Rhizobacter sp.]|jgi:hypothetical protein